MTKELKSYNALNILAGGDYQKLKNLLEKYHSWQKIWENTNSNLNPEKEWQKLEEEGVKLILKEEAGFPPLLKEISWPPFGIYIKGKFPLPEEKIIAVVGTRKATDTGKNFAQKLAQELCENSLIVASGLAMGIDESAHQGAVKAGGKTVAVLPVGLDKIYPRQNINLAKKILDCGGALISEYPFDMPSYPANFIQRNRLVSGLSIAAVIVEAPEKSGALSTARFALEQNREIFVAPGPINHPNYKGSHRLIREGARLIASADDIFQDLGLELKNKKPNPEENMSQEEKMVLETIKEIGWPSSIDKIAEKTKIEIPRINQLITFLTIKGLIK